MRDDSEPRSQFEVGDLVTRVGTFVFSKELGVTTPAVANIGKVENKFFRYGRWFYSVNWQFIVSLDRMGRLETRGSPVVQEHIETGLKDATELFDQVMSNLEISRGNLLKLREIALEGRSPDYGDFTPYENVLSPE